MMSWRAAQAAKQSPCLPGDCFPYATLHHAPLVAGETCASLAVTYVESVCNRATFVLQLLRGYIEQGMAHFSAKTPFPAVIALKGEPSTNA